MHEYWHVILESIIHTVKILPFLFIVYYLIELFEFKCAIKIQNNKMLKGKASPLFGATLGCIPQCGVSVVSTDLYSKKIISVGALIAVYIATSDEAIPLMFANPDSIPSMFMLIAIKIVFGVVVGYLSMFLYKLFFKKNSTHKEHIEHYHEEHKEHIEHHHEEHEEHEHNEEVTIHGGCCHHDVETKSFNWLHPMLHCLKISLFILLINVIFGFITHIWVGEEVLKQFLTNSIYIQPLLAVLIGLIPNCASSVVMTEMFLIGGLSFGSLVAGLCVNAGLGLIVLFKQNKNWKENLFIMLMLIIPSLILGYLINFVIMI